MFANEGWVLKRKEIESNFTLLKCYLLVPSFLNISHLYQVYIHYEHKGLRPL